ncbi:MAG: hypothetical protein PHH28_05570 [Desulfuromonadaceae bacterium]|nr:hypothetical protein [Desulfuromonadaceae bacterium]
MHAEPGQGLAGSFFGKQCGQHPCCQIGPACLVPEETADGHPHEIGQTVGFPGVFFQTTQIGCVIVKAEFRYPLIDAVPGRSPAVFAPFQAEQRADLAQKVVIFHYSFL